MATERLPMDLTTVADELYALNPDEFTRTRNERAKQARAQDRAPDRAQDRALGEAIRRLPKPSTAAWVVNMLVRHRTEQLANVLELGASLRQAQENLDGAQMRELNKQRRQLTAAVTSQARSVADELGVRVSESVAKQVEETLRAAMTDEGAARAVRTGQLVEALSATGVGELDVSAAVAVPEAIGLTARPVERRGPGLRVLGSRGAEPGDRAAGDRDAADRDTNRARQVAEEAEVAATKADKKLDKATRRVARLEARSLRLHGELEELRRRVSELEHELESVEDGLTSAEDKRDRAREKQESARAAADEARSAVADLER